MEEVAREGGMAVVAMAGVERGTAVVAMAVGVRVRVMEVVMVAPMASMAREAVGTVGGLEAERAAEIVEEMAGMTVVVRAVATAQSRAEVTVGVQRVAGTGGPSTRRMRHYRRPTARLGRRV